MMNEFQRRIGVGERSRFALRHQGTSRSSAVVREEGRTRGSNAGTTTEHWDGRVDSAVSPAPLNVTISRSERKVVDVAS